LFYDILHRFCFQYGLSLINDGVDMKYQQQTAKLLALNTEAEKHALNFLFSAAEIVRLLQKVVHAIQLERGASVLYLTSRGSVAFGIKIQAYRNEFERQEGLFKARLDKELDAPFNLPSGVYLRLASVLQGLEGLASLRKSVDKQGIQPLEAIQGFSQIIHSIFNYVFELAEQAPEAEIARAMLALFNLMQAKEAAGQERAIGVALLGAGEARINLCEVLNAKIEQQSNAFSVFKLFATESQLAKLVHLKSKPYRQALETWRQGFRFHKQADFEKAEAWFDLMTQRIDGFQSLEDELTSYLQLVSAKRLKQGVQQANQRCDSIERVLADQQLDINENMTKLQGASKILLERFQAQSKQLMDMEAELVVAKQALLDRRFIERAKSMLILQKGLTEEQAHQFLQAQAMKTGQRLVDVAQLILK
jgi:hypothetical protein